jgi:hypothetical protein
LAQSDHFGNLMIRGIDIIAFLLSHLDGPLPELGSQLGDHLTHLEQFVLLQSPLGNIIEVFFLGELFGIEKLLPV